MFEELFKQRHVWIRHRHSPFAKERALFLRHLANQGWSRNTLYSLASALRLVAERIDQAHKSQFTLEDVKTITDRYTRCPVHGKRTTHPCWVPSRYERIARNFLAFIGRLAPSQAKNVLGKELIDAYAIWIEQDCGFSSFTTARRNLERFFAWYSTQGRPLSQIKPSDIDRYVARTCKQLSRVALVFVLGRLKSFFRYAENRSWCARGIADSIEMPRIYKHENIPLGPSWADVKRLLDSTRTDNPYDIRDRAILFLLAIYGLRRGEVVRLRLEDFDWENELLHIPRSKQRKRAIYPLVRSVGDAVIRYLKKVRQRCDRPEVFLALNAPIRSLAGVSITTMVGQRMKALGIQSPHFGSHSLRHASATHLVSQGFSFKEIGDHLGHQNPMTTRVYAKVDLEGLRQVASFDLGGIL